MLAFFISLYMEVCLRNLCRIYPVLGLGHQKDCLIVFLAEQALQCDIRITFDVTAFNQAAKRQIDRSEWQRNVSEENNFAVLHGSRGDGDLEDSGRGVVKRDVSG